MTPLHVARRMARREARFGGHKLGQFRRALHNRRQHVATCRRCGGHLWIKPNPRGPGGEWLFDGAALKECPGPKPTMGY